MTGWYVYALTGAAAPPFRAGHRQIEFVRIGQFHAAIARMAEAPALSEAALQDQHAIVSAIAGKVDALLPARFGAFVDEAELAAIVEWRAGAIAEALALVRGREQMTVRITGEPESAPVHAIDSPSGTDYLQQRRAAASPPFPHVVAAIEKAVRSIAGATRVEPGRDRARTSVYHLIERGTSDVYRDALRSMPQTVTASLEIVVSGPWPPFAFAPELLA